MNKLIAVTETKDGDTPITIYTDSIVFIKRWIDKDTGKSEGWNFAIYYNQYNSPKRVRIDQPQEIPFPKIIDKNGDEIWLNLLYVKSHRKFFDKRCEKFIIEVDARFDPMVERSVNFIVKVLPEGL